MITIEIFYGWVAPAEDTTLVLKRGGQVVRVLTGSREDVLLRDALDWLGDAAFTLEQNRERLHFKEYNAIVSSAKASIEGRKLTDARTEYRTD